MYRAGLILRACRRARERASERWRAVARTELSSEMEEAVLPRSVILRLEMEDSESVGSLKGARRRPGLGVMSSFWLEGGMEKSFSICEERSDIVALEGNMSGRGCWWNVIVRVIVSSSSSGTWTLFWSFGLSMSLEMRLEVAASASVTCCDI